MPTSCEEGRLFSAAERGDLDEVKRLVLHYAAPLHYDAAPLHYAAGRGHLDVVKFLLEHGADPNVKGGYFDDTPLHYAAEKCRVFDVARVLLDYGADPTIRDNEGKTPLDYGSDCEEIIEELRRRGGRTTVYE